MIVVVATRSECMDRTDKGDEISELLEGDRDLARARQELEARVADVVPDAFAQWELMGYILTEFEPVVQQSCLEAFLRAHFGDPRKGGG